MRNGPHYSEDDIFNRPIWSLFDPYTIADHSLDENGIIVCTKLSACKLCKDEWLKFNLQNFILKYF